MSNKKNDSKNSILAVLAVLAVLVLIFGMITTLRKDDNGGGKDSNSSSNVDNTEPVETKPLDDACEHEFGDPATQKEATCLEEGLARRVCSKCGGTTDSSIPVSQAHTYTKYLLSTDEKNHYSDCDVCGARVIEEHITKTTKVEATCLVDGKMITECTKCKTKLSDDIILAFGHNVSSFLPSAIDVNLHLGTCSVCEEQVKEIHNFGAWVNITPATCTEVGIQKHTCSVCGYSESRDVVPLQHNYVFSEEKFVPATETENGSFTEICSRCNDEKTITILAGHLISANYKDNIGKGYYCPVCNKVIFYSHIHKFDDVYCHQDPTCSNVGIYAQFCSECEYAHTDFYEGTEYAPHDYEWDVDREIHVCVNCGKTTVLCNENCTHDPKTGDGPIVSV